MIMPVLTCLQGSYLLLLDYTSRLCRAGKARVGREVVSILDRWGTSAEVWGLRVQRLLSQDRLLGSDIHTLTAVAPKAGERTSLHDNACPYPYLSDLRLGQTRIATGQRVQVRCISHG